MRFEEDGSTAKSAEDAKNAKGGRMESVDDIVGFEEPSSDLDRLAYRVLGAAIEVNRSLGPGFSESAYDAALRVELTLRGIPFEPQFKFDLTYKGHPIGEG